mgnify:FL=1
MTPLSGSLRAYKLMKTKGKNLLQALGDESKKALIGQELKVKKHNVCLGFNAPKDDSVGTHVKASIYPMGAHHEKACEKLVNIYEETLNPK